MNLRANKVFILMGLLVLGLSGSAKAQTTYTVSDLGMLTDTNGEVVGGASVNAWGVVVGQEILPAGPRRAFAWKAGKVIDLGTLGGPSAGARDINAFDFVAGTADRADNKEHAVLWRVPAAPGASPARAVDLGTFGGNGSEGNGINNLGFVVGFAYTPTPDPTFTLEFGQIAHAFVWAGRLHDLGTLGGPNSIAIAINDRSTVVGWSQQSLNAGVFGIPDLHATIWKNGKITDLGSFGGPISLALSVNNLDIAVGQSMDPSFNPHAFVWHNQILTDLGTLPGDAASGAAGINNLGQIVGFSAGGSGQSACLWHDLQAIDLNTRITDTRWQLAVANSVNDAGLITGYGLLNGELHSFLLTPTNRFLVRDDQNQGDDPGKRRAHLPESIREWMALHKSGLDHAKLKTNHER